MVAPDRFRDECRRVALAREIGTVDLGINTKTLPFSSKPSNGARCQSGSISEAPRELQLLLSSRHHCVRRRPSSWT